MRLVPLKVVPRTEAEEHICPYRRREPSIGCMKLRDIRRDELLSLEERHPSMGKMPGAGGKRGRRRMACVVESGLKTNQLGVREGVEKRLQEDDGLTKAGI